MKNTFVFGYGSLVNRATHDYDQMYPAKIRGWRRTWRHVEGRNVAFLTVIRSSADEIDGLIAGVEAEDWPALDKRERFYLREKATDVAHPLPDHTDIRIYHAPKELHRPADGHHPVLLSYLDVVIQGFFREFGGLGVERFFETTDGWDAPVLDDRAEPRYQRHQVLSDEERDLTDTALRRLGVTILT